MEENCKDIILNGLSSLFEDGKFYNLSFILSDYYENPSDIIKKSPSQLNLSDEQKSCTLKIAEIISFVHKNFKFIPLEDIIIPVLLSSIELSLWFKSTDGREIIEKNFFASPVYSLPVFVDFYLSASNTFPDANGNLERMSYGIKKLIDSRHSDLSFKCDKLSEDILSKEFEIYEKYKLIKWFGITSYILTREFDIVRCIENL